MKKTIKTGEAVQAYNTAKNLALKGVERKDVFVLIRDNNVLKKTATAYEDFVKDAQERLKPEGWDAIAEKLRSKTELTAKESEVSEKYNRDLVECINGELEKTVELELEPLTEDGVYALIAANETLNVDAVALIQSVFCE